MHHRTRVLATVRMQFILIGCYDGTNYPFLGQLGIRRRLDLM